MEPNFIDYLLAGVYLFACRAFWDASDHFFDEEDKRTAYTLVAISACFGASALIRMGI